MKRKVFRLLLISCLLFLFGDAYSQEWIPVNGKAYGEPFTIKVLKDDASSYQVEVTINGIYDQLITNKSGNYHHISFGVGGTLLTSGEPVLPLISRLVAIPTGAKVSASIADEHWTDIEIGTILPAQITPSGSKGTMELYINDKVYTHPFVPSVVSVGEEHEWHSIRNVGVCVCPFKYFPSENKLSVLSKFILKVDFEHPFADKSFDTAICDGNKEFGLFDNTVYSLPDRAQSNIYNNNYLIIVGNNPSILNSEALTKFKRWKALRGFNTTIISLSEILSSPSFSQDQVREYIQNVVGGGGYVLFIGDNSSIPTASVSSYYFNSQTIKGDYWYGYGSGYGDIAVGRFSTNSAWEFKKMVEKTIRYESTCPLSDSVLLVAHKADPFYYRGYQYWCEQIKNANYMEPLPIATAYGANNATNAYVIDKINQGVPIVCYIGYGQSNYWGGIYGGDPDCSWNTSGESFYSSGVGNMNSNSCAVFFSNSSNTANICVNGNMLEAFIRATDGAVAYVGSTTENDASNDYNELFSYALFDNMLNDGIYLLGDLTNTAHIATVNSFNGASLVKDNANSYICGGDPALELWTGTPQTFGNVILTEGNGTITITTAYSGDYKVCVVSEDGNLIGVYPVYSDDSCTFPRPSDNFYIGINKHNYLPHIIYYNTDAETIQNVTFNYDAYCHHTPLAIGDGVSVEESGPVVVKEGSKLIIKNGTGGVYFDAGIECELGGILEVK